MKISKKYFKNINSVTNIVNKNVTYQLWNKENRSIITLLKRILIIFEIQNLEKGEKHIIHKKEEKNVQVVLSLGL